MPKQYELLAVERNLKTQANKTRTELQATFEKKKHVFTEKVITFTPYNEAEDKPEKTVEATIQATVPGEIDWIKVILSKHIDAAFQIDVANTQAKADVILEDGQKLLADVPATALLQLEHRIEEVKALATSLPTFDSAQGFTPDAQKGKFIYKAREIRKPRTRKDSKVIQLAKATDKHAEQVQLKEYDREIGTYLVEEWSALTTSAKKADTIDRCEKLLRAVKQARARANEASVVTDTQKVGKSVLDYIFAPVFQSEAAAGASN